MPSFVRNVAILTSGTVIAQVFTVAVTPILSRIYEPSAFGILGVLVATAAPIVAIASLKYDSAIVFTQDDSDATGLLAICVAVCSAITLVATLVILGIREWLATRLGGPSASDFLLALPLIILFGGLYTAASASSNRHKKYNDIANALMARSGATSTMQIVLGLLNSGAMGLVFGRIVGRFLAILALLRGGHILAELNLGFRHGLTELRRIARDHNQFPRYQAPRALLNSISQEMLSVLLALFFGAAVAGFYWFTARLIDMPTTLVGNSVRQVFYQKASEKFWNGESLFPIWIKTTASLTALASPPTAILVAFGPDFFELVFGQQWREAGVYAQWLVVWWLSTFVNIPSATLIPVYSLQGLFLIFEIIGITMRLTAIYLGVILEDAHLSIILYSVVGIILNGILLLYMLHHIRRHSSALTLTDVRPELDDRET